MFLSSTDTSKVNLQAWYDTAEGIALSVKTLAGLNELEKARRQAGKLHQSLTEYIILGRWRLDSCGNTMKALGTSRMSMTPLEAFASIGRLMPPVITEHEMWRILRDSIPNEQDQPSMSFSFMSELPPSNMVCTECGYPFDIRDCHDVVHVGENVVVELDDYVGMTIGQFRSRNEGRPDALYVFNQDLVIKNDSFICLDPMYPNTKNDWERDVVKNKNGWMSATALTEWIRSCWATMGTETFDSYVIQPGDKTYFTKVQYYHSGCRQYKVDTEVRAQFEKAFLDSGVAATKWEEVPNQYGSQSYNGQWYLVTTDIGVVRVGWRKRVIEIVFPVQVDVGELFANENTTKSENLIHAWGYDKLTEYLQTAVNAFRFLQG